MLKIVIATLIAVFGMLPVHAADSGELDIQVYNPGEKGIFAVSSEIISGKSEVVLIDAQFARNDAQVLVDKIKSTGKRLTTVYISHSDPDYYFGLDTIKAAFPQAKIIATPQTVAAIAASKDSKLAYWGPILKDNAPKSDIVPDVLKGDKISVDGQPLRIMGRAGPAPERSYVWVSSKKAVLGGVVVIANQHVWIADTQTLASRRDWRKALASIAALKPAQVVPGHFSLNTDGSQPFTMQAVKFTQDYLAAFEIEASRAKDSETLIAAMKVRYPNLAGESSLELSAKVIMGEMKWPAEAH